VHKKSVYKLIILSGILLAVILANCVQKYRPQTEWEEEAFNRSRPDIHPYDLRSKFEKYQYIPIRWAGIIRESEFYETEDAYEVVILLEHRYFDWKVDAMSSPELYYPSIHGEGFFQTSWYLTKDADLDYFVDRFGPGNLAIVYGVPDQVVEEIVLLRAEYIRIIDAAKVQADQLDYIPKEALNRPVESTSYSN
jgi:hypothetical protein